MEEKETSKGFIKECLFFQGKEPLTKFLGVFVWINIISGFVKILELVFKLLN